MPNYWMSDYPAYQTTGYRIIEFVAHNQIVFAQKNQTIQNKQLAILTMSNCFFMIIIIDTKCLYINKHRIIIR